MSALNKNGCAVPVCIPEMEEVSSEYTMIAVRSHFLYIYIRLTCQGPECNLIFIFIIEAEEICLIFFQGVCKV